MNLAFYLVDVLFEGEMMMDSGVTERALVLHGGAGITWRWKVDLPILSLVLVDQQRGICSRCLL